MSWISMKRRQKWQCLVPVDLVHLVRSTWDPCLLILSQQSETWYLNGTKDLWEDWLNGTNDTWMTSQWHLSHQMHLYAVKIKSCITHQSSKRSSSPRYNTRARITASHLASVLRFCEEINIVSIQWTVRVRTYSSSMCHDLQSHKGKIGTYRPLGFSGYFTLNYVLFYSMVCFGHWKWNIPMCDSIFHKRKLHVWGIVLHEWQCCLLAKPSPSTPDSVCSWEASAWSPRYLPWSSSRQWALACWGQVWTGISAAGDL